MSVEDIRDELARQLSIFQESRESTPVEPVSEITQEILDKLNVLEQEQEDEIVDRVTDKLTATPIDSIYRIGIDPGVTGAITVHNLSSDEYTIFDMPVFQVTKKDGKKRTYYDAKGLQVLLMPYANGAATVEDLEAVAAIPQKTGAKFTRGSIANFSLGYGMGVIDTILLVLNIKTTKVRPAVWKAHALKGVSDKTDKDSVRQFAIRLFPNMYPELSRKMDHNRAESLLLCTYGEVIEGIKSQATFF